MKNSKKLSQENIDYMKHYRGTELRIPTIFEEVVMISGCGKYYWQEGELNPLTNKLVKEIRKEKDYAFKQEFGHLFQ